MKDSERSLATAAWRASGQYLAAILNDSIRFMVLEEKVVKEIIHAQKSVSAQDDSIIDHLKKPLLGQLLRLVPPAAGLRGAHARPLLSPLGSTGMRHRAAAFQLPLNAPSHVPLPRTRVITTSIHTYVAGRSEPQSWDKNETTSSVLFAQMFAKHSEPPNSDVGGSDSRTRKRKKIGIKWCCWAATADAR